MQYRAAGAAYELMHPGVKIDVRQFERQAMNSGLAPRFGPISTCPSWSTWRSRRPEPSSPVPSKKSASSISSRVSKRRASCTAWWQSRFAPYTNRGHIFGMPHDVHPVLFAYRKDVFDQEHIDPDTIQTWDDFIKVGRRLRRLPGEHPDGARYIIQLPKAEGWGVEILDVPARRRLLRSRRTTHRSTTTRSSRPSRCTFRWCRSRPHLGRLRQLGTADGSRDGRCAHARVLGARLAVPAFRKRHAAAAGQDGGDALARDQAGGRRTSTWGGTMIGITKHSKDVDRAWEIAEIPLHRSRELGAAVGSNRHPSAGQGSLGPAGFPRAERVLVQPEARRDPGKRRPRRAAAIHPPFHRSRQEQALRGRVRQLALLRGSRPRRVRRFRAREASPGRRRRQASDAKESILKSLNRRIAPMSFLAPFALSFVGLHRLSRW